MIELFKCNGNIDKNAYPNWRRTSYPNMNFYKYAEMFKSSGDKLIDSIRDNKHKAADEIINPTLYLYRHSIELFLKAILVTDYLLEDYKYHKIQDKLQGHSLESLWSKTDHVIRKYYKSDVKEDKKPLTDARKAVNELAGIDTDSTTFRYPYDRELKKQVVADGKSSYAIDYINLKNEFNNLYEFLEGCFLGIYDIYENQETIRVFNIDD